MLTQMVTTSARQSLAATLDLTQRRGGRQYIMSLLGAEEQLTTGTVLPASMSVRPLLVIDTSTTCRL